VSVSAAPAFDQQFRDSLLELLRWRRDVRHFRTDPIPREILAELVEGASLAPSVGYSQPWRFVSVEDPARRAEIAANFERCNAAALATYTAERRESYARLKLAGLREAPAHVAVFADRAGEAGARLGRSTMPQTLEYSVVGAISMLWLLARARGIGVGWVSILEAHEVAKTLDVPLAWTLVAYLCIGYPNDEDDTPELARVKWQAPLEAARILHVR
jgi:5,6-dimethylbenzimidazole synthase